MIWASWSDFFDMGGIRILCMGILHSLGHLHRRGSDTGLKTQTNFIETS